MSCRWKLNGGVQAASWPSAEWQRAGGREEEASVGFGQQLHIHVGTDVLGLGPARWVGQSLVPRPSRLAKYS